ncbi:MarR family winged helix-turn-helix transcriptional regulator [Nonomuraea angiospora]|uniref:DNA-binding MarR family transcriptional regulator n=1 Tax=Nonomuraea angiospora TaxID=46172 RepID=A0ABR9MKT9_9ACTN|nr:MarR family transcriptional regulator [Nonomuraea angiospora]MBE1593339.1 DNA-binding MarR family transcriptional regulator [Nonomuraea angiospora]
MADAGTRPPSLLALASYLASQAAKYGYRQLEAVLAEHHLLLGHHAVLAALDDFGPLSQQQLADSLDFDKSHLVGRIDHLEERDLVTRTRDRVDRRRHQVALTPVGKALVDKLRPAAQESQRQFLSALSATERETLISLLQRVLAVNDAVRHGLGNDDVHP